MFYQNTKTTWRNIWLFIIIAAALSIIYGGWKPVLAQNQPTNEAREQCTVKQTGLTGSATKEQLCLTGTYCDTKNQRCVECISGDINKTCKPTKQINSVTGKDEIIEKVCVQNRCVPLSTSLPKLTVKDPATGEEKQMLITGPASYILYIYNWGLRIAGILAFLLIIIYGLGYVASFGNEQRIKDYKEKLTNVFIGVVVLLGSFIILQTINPTLTQLKEPKMEVLEIPEFFGVCAPNGTQDDVCKLVKVTKKNSEEVKKQYASLRTCSILFVNQPCACRIERMVWGTSENNLGGKSFKVSGESMPITVYPSGCDENNNRDFILKIYADDGYTKRELKEYSHSFTINNNQPLIFTDRFILNEKTFLAGEEGLLTKGAGIISDKLAKIISNADFTSGAVFQNRSEFTARIESADGKMPFIYPAPAKIYLYWRGATDYTDDEIKNSKELKEINDELIRQDLEKYWEENVKPKNSQGHKPQTATEGVVETMIGGGMLQF